MLVGFYLDWRRSEIGWLFLRRVVGMETRAFGPVFFSGVFWGGIPRMAGREGGPSDCFLS